MPLIPMNFPDQVWARLKAWAKLRAADGDQPSRDECAEEVLRASEHITGQRDTLRAEVVKFYAAETAEMVEKFRAQLLDGVAHAERRGPEDATGTGLESAV